MHNEKFYILKAQRFEMNFFLVFHAKILFVSLFKPEILLIFKNHGKNETQLCHNISYIF